MHGAVKTLDFILLLRLSSQANHSGRKMCKCGYQLGDVAVIQKGGDELRTKVIIAGTERRDESKNM